MAVSKSLFVENSSGVISKVCYGNCFPTGKNLYWPSAIKNPMMMMMMSLL